MDIVDANKAIGEQISLNFKVKGSKLPLVTVVTVVFNGKDYLEETIQSILNQTYPNIEYIIIDGGSTDDTLDIIRRYDDSIDYWVSEKDNGIYDAMNKGIEVATGEWINFMNAGDVFFSADTVTRLFDGDRYDEEVVYGDVHIRYPDFSRIERAGRLSRLWRGMQFCHQSAFVRTRCHKLNQFNATNTIAADLEFFYGSYENGVRFKYQDLVIASVTTGGVSESNRIKTILASRDAVCKNGCGQAIELYYIFRCFDANVRRWLKNVLPRKVTRKIIQMKN